VDDAVREVETEIRATQRPHRMTHGFLT
jgi:hypothetical protein